MVIRKGNTKGKLGTRTIPIIQELRLLLETYSHPDHPYLFPSRHLNHRWKHANPEAASHLFQEACDMSASSALPPTASEGRRLLR
jgi:integrase/recombinase XerD